MIRKTHDALPQVLTRIVFLAGFLTGIGLLLSSCTGSESNPSLTTLLKLNTKRLTFVYFFTPG
jgi:hypothetical protein